MAEFSGQSFAGYEIVAKLGEGGFGAVYKARQPTLDRLVALKILAPHLAADAEFVARFKREATLAASLNHPNMVLVFAAGESDGGHYMAMEFIEGETLRHRIENQGRLDSREAIAVAVYVAQALQYAWNKSHLIHRDIKPDNVFLSKAGEVKVGDLGLAKNVGQSTAGMTATGMMMGSPHYISPEQASAKKDIDFRADIYSLGCTLYHMLTGKPPYEGNDPMVVMGQHVNAPPPAMFKVWPQCPMPLGLLVGKMLKKNPRERQQSYEELIAELTAVHEKIAAMQAAAAAPPSGTITFLFTDIEGSTQLWEKHPQAMPVALERHNQLLRRAVESHGGFVFKTVGDAFCVAFASAPNAMAAALAAQRALAAEPWGETGPLRVRMALHTGAAEERGGDYFGPTLNRVARVLAAGHGGQILLSNATEQLVRDHLTEGASLGDLGERSLKNLTRTERIFQINLPDLPTQFPTLRSAATHSPDHRRRQMMIYGGTGVAAVVMLAGLLLWSPWKQSRTGVPPVQSSTTGQAGRLSYSDAAALKLLGNVFTNAVGGEMVYIPPGEFMMGSTKEEQAWAVANGVAEEYVKREGAAPRKTRIKQGFWMGRTEVTVGQWKEFVTATGYKTDAEKKGYVDNAPRKEQPWGRADGLSWRNPGFGSAPQDNHPVCCVSWNDAVVFCEWLTERERKAGRLAAGQVVRLPTEAEWEYACRAGTQTKFWWGESKEDGKDRLNWSGTADGFHFTSPVDSYGARGRNAFGLADMLGNVYEWCLDEYDAKQAHEECYKGNPGGRVLRGGSFNTIPAEARAAERRRGTPAGSDSRDGFRVGAGADLSGSTTAAASTSPAGALKETEVLAPAETRVPALTANPKRGEVFTLPLASNVTLELVGIPSGEFLLGSTEAERQWSIGPEGKQIPKTLFESGEPKRTQIKNGFWMGRTEVTVGQWQRFVKATGYITEAEKEGYVDLAPNPKGGVWIKVEGKSWRDPGFGFPMDEKHPACCISWNDAVAFCQWLTESERQAGRLPAGLVYRLPAEAEWEYACRGGKEGKRFWWGDEVKEGNGRFNGPTHVASPWADDYMYASPVDVFGERGRNGFGLADMLGNVYEWCLDFCDPKGAHEEPYLKGASEYVLRGGSFNCYPGYIRCASRDRRGPSRMNANYGFRVCAGMSYDRSGSSTSSASARATPTVSPASQPSPAVPVSDASSLANPKAGESRLLDLGGGVTLEFAGIPPGEFMLGSTAEEQAWAVANGVAEEYVKREGAAPRKTRIKDGFWLGRTEVTVGQWKQFVAATGYKTNAEKKGFVFSAPRKDQPWGRVDGLSWCDPGFGSAPQDRDAVSCISWNDAVAFCEWLTECERKAGRLPTGQVIRLPTEAEWEYACRAGTQTKFWWGESNKDGKDRWNLYGKADRFEWVAPADSFGSRGRNGFGLADMLGNVCEWCLDEYDAKEAHEECYKGNPVARVFRGGTFNTNPAYCRCACREGVHPSYSHSGYGFRVAVGLAR